MVFIESSWTLRTIAKLLSPASPAAGKLLATVLTASHHLLSVTPDNRAGNVVGSSLQKHAFMVKLRTGAGMVQLERDTQPTANP